MWDNQLAQPGLKTDVSQNKSEISKKTIFVYVFRTRQSEDGKISEDTRNVVIVIDGFRGVNDDNVREAMDELCGLFKEMFGMSTITGMVDSENNVFEW